MVLKKFKGVVIINSTVHTLQETDPSFVRINAWPGFLNGKFIEGSVVNEETKSLVARVFEQFNKSIEWLPDEPGFVTARVISMIINEAYFALEEGVSGKEEIDTAMKLGTAYPFGPFEWASKIGIARIVALLNRLSKNEQKYLPAPLLVEEALTAKV
jgi:3-hydroxybutyryl-CoA dehydrogenase